MWSTFLAIAILAAIWVLWCLIFWGRIPTRAETAGHQLVNHARRRRPF